MCHKEYVSNILSIEENFTTKEKKKLRIWPYIRMRVFYRLLAKSTQSAKAHSFTKHIRMKIFNFSWVFKKSDTLFIYSQRYLNNKEIYLDRIYDLTEGSKVKFSFSENGNFVGDVFFLDFFKIIFYLISKTLSFIIILNNVEKKFLHDFKFNLIEISSMYKVYLIDFTLWYYFYYFILKILKVERVYYVGGVYFSPLVKAADKLDIETIEIQHGVINNQHLAYHFPGFERDSFFAKKIYLLSSKWIENISFPIKTLKYVLGNDYFYKEIDHSISKNKILIVSSDIHSDFFYNLSFEIAKKFPDYKIQLRPHPKEIIKNGQFPFTIDSSNSIDYDLMSSHFVVSPCSTMGFISLDFQIPTYVIDFGEGYFDSFSTHPYLMKIFKHNDVCLDQINVSFECSNRSSELFFEEFQFPPRPI